MFRLGVIYKSYNFWPSLGRPRGLMDMASDFGSEDCGFESRRGQCFGVCHRIAWVETNSYWPIVSWQIALPWRRLLEKEMLEKPNQTFPSYCTEMHCMTISKRNFIFIEPWIYFLDCLSVKTWQSICYERSGTGWKQKKNPTIKISRFW